MPTVLPEVVPTVQPTVPIPGSPSPDGRGGGGVPSLRPKRTVKPVTRLDPNPYLRSYDKVLLAEEVAFHVTVAELDARRGAEAVKHSVLEELKNIFDVMKAMSPATAHAS